MARRLACAVARVPPVHPAVAGAVMLAASSSSCVKRGEHRKAHLSECQDCPVCPARAKLSAPALRVIHDGDRDTVDPTITLSPPPRKEGTPCAGDRPTMLFRERALQDETGMCTLVSACVEDAAATAADLATYWANSARVYALKGSPFLRPPVCAVAWRITLHVLPTATSQANSTLMTTVHLRCVQERHILELDVNCAVLPCGAAPDDKSCAMPCAEASVWCKGLCCQANPVPPEGRQGSGKSGRSAVQGAVVPPVPLLPTEAEAAGKRLKAQRQRAELLFRVPVRPSDAQCSLGPLTAGPLPLGLVQRQANVAAQEAEAVGRAALKASQIVPESQSCYGDVGPLVAAAMQAAHEALRTQQAIANRESSFRVTTVDIDVSPLVQGDVVNIHARVDDMDSSEEDKVASISVTGWQQGKIVLRARVVT